MGEGENKAAVAWKIGDIPLAIGFLMMASIPASWVAMVIDEENMWILLAFVYAALLVHGFFRKKGSGWRLIGNAAGIILLMGILIWISGGTVFGFAAFLTIFVLWIVAGLSSDTGASGGEIGGGRF